MATLSPNASRASVCVAGEIVARWLWIETPRPPPPVVPPGDWPTFHGLAEAHEPGQQGIYRGVFYRTNEQGYRGPAWAFEPEPGVARVLLIGDSVAVGSGVAEADRYSDLVPALLSADTDLPPVEVLNMSRGGSDVVNARVRMAFALRDVGAHVTVYGFSVDDLRDAVPRLELPARERWAQTHRRVAVESPTSFLWRTVVHLVRAGAGGSLLDDEVRVYLANEDAWLTLRDQLERMGRLNERAGTCGLVFIQPRLYDLGPGHPYRAVYARVAEEAAAAGLFVHSAFSAFMWQSALPLWVGVNDRHPNAAGHAILAESLAEGLRGLPSRCWGR